MPTLTLRRIDSKGKAGLNFRFELPDVFFIGRDEKCKLAVDWDTSVSRIHCIIDASSGSCTITDHGSTNGTAVNGKKIAVPTPLKAGDRIMLGSTEFLVGFSADHVAPEEEELGEEEVDDFVPRMDGMEPPRTSTTTPTESPTDISSLSTDEMIGLVQQGLNCQSASVVFQSPMSRVVELKDAAGHTHIAEVPEKSFFQESSVAGYQSRLESLKQIRSAYLTTVGVTMVGPYLVLGHIRVRGLLVHDLASYRSPSRFGNLCLHLATALSDIHGSGNFYGFASPLSVYVSEDGSRVQLGRAALAPRLFRLSDAVDRATPEESKLILSWYSPENLGGSGASQPLTDDVFGICAVLYFLATGRSHYAFPAKVDRTSAMTLGRSYQAPDASQRPPFVTEALWAAITRGMSANPAERPQDGAALHQLLRGALGQ